MPKEKKEQKSAPSRVDTGVKEQKSKHKRNINIIKKYNKIISFCLCTMIACVFVVLFKNYANKSNLNSEFYLFWSDFIFGIITAITGDIIVSILAKAKLGKNGIWVFGMLLCATTLCFSIAGLLRVKGLCEKNIEENQMTRKENQSNEVVGGSNSDTKQNKIYYVHPYIFEEDPFFEDKEKYLGAKKSSLPDDEILQYMAETIYYSIDITNFDETMIPDAYTQFTEAANLQYDTYLSQRKRDWDLDKENTYYTDYVKQKRIEDLKSVIDELICADGEYINSENRRQIAICYKDLGDEHAHIDNQNEAATAFEECAKWAMKSMHVAIKNGNHDEYKNALKQLSNASDAMSGLGTIGEPRKNKLKLCYIAYELILNTYMS